MDRALVVLMNMKNATTQKMKNLHFETYKEKIKAADSREIVKRIEESMSSMLRHGLITVPDYYKLDGLAMDRLDEIQSIPRRFPTK
jgi:hypothetical protein